MNSNMNPKLKRLIAETEELKRQITNLKARIRRRGKRLVNTFDPLERKRSRLRLNYWKRKCPI